MKDSATLNDEVITQTLDRLREMLEAEYESILQPFDLTKYAADLARGKFFRSHLLLLSAGKVDERALARCMALELLHTSTLVHDDIIDQATLRRDKPTLWHALGAEQALIIGNLITTRALSIAAEDSADLCREFLRAYAVVNQGQLHEMLHYGRLRSEEKYREIIVGKTSVMIELALYAGASLSSEWPCDITNLTNAVRDVGIVFQVKDDIEDVEAWLKRDTADRSKAAEFDIELQNYTLPVTIATHSENLSGTLSPEQIRRIPTDVWRQSLDASNEYADTYIKQTQQELLSGLQGEGRELAARVSLWSENFLKHVQKQSLDEAVKRNDQS